jgi:molybdopterin-guanine dinucleotide biosynthesis protein A
MKNFVSCAAILAGGASSRMGREKALISWHGQPLIRHVAAVLEPIFPQICVITHKIEVARAAALPAIADHFEARGPLGGIHAALTHFEAPTFIVACDMPFLSADFIKYLSQNFAENALVPLGESGFEPLHAIYAPHLAPRFESYLGQQKVPSMRRVLEEIDAQFVPLEVARGFDAQLKCFSNWNTPADIETGDAARAT